ncbi:MAG: peptidase MA family metallohydrolase [Clostridia bacterium]|nr:peptidase MA family metallohydrolase [Clostridia bacterium]
MYYYQDEDFVKSKAEDFNSVYKEVVGKLKHKGRTNPKEDGKILCFFLDDNTYKAYTKDMIGGANWRDSGGFINLNKQNSPSLLSTFRHELIHAVTFSSDDTKVKNCPGWFADGIAQYYQPDIHKGRYNEKMIKDSVAKNEIVSWDALIPMSGDWGSDKRALKYMQSACIYEYLIQTYGEDKINSIFYTEGNFNDIIKNVTGKTVIDLEADWNTYISNKYKGE